MEEFQDIPAAEVEAAAHKAWEELAAVHTDIQKKGEETLQYLKETGRRGIVLAGRPYHIDPEIHHGIPDTDQQLRNRRIYRRLRLHTLDIWSVPSVSTTSGCITPDSTAAANFVKTREDLDLIQLNSFGCGLDAVTTDEVNEILDRKSDKIYTCLKIDEVNNLGAARIRIRSLIAAIRAKQAQNKTRNIKPASIEKISFTKQMRKDYTILCPQMSPIPLRNL